MVADCGRYNVTTYIDKGRKKRKEERKRKKEKIYYNKLIIEKLLLSDSFMEGKCPRVKLEKSNEMTKRISIRIPIIVILSALNWIKTTWSAKILP